MFNTSANYIRKKKCKFLCRLKLNFAHLPRIFLICCKLEYKIGDRIIIKRVVTIWDVSLVWQRSSHPCSSLVCSTAAGPAWSCSALCYDNDCSKRWLQAAVLQWGVERGTGGQLGAREPGYYILDISAHHQHCAQPRCNVQERFLLRGAESTHDKFYALCISDVCLIFLSISIIWMIIVMQSLLWLQIKWKNPITGLKVQLMMYFCYCVVWSQATLLYFLCCNQKSENTFNSESAQSKAHLFCRFSWMSQQHHIPSKQSTK